LPRGTLQARSRSLTPDGVLAAYDAVSVLYPFVPSLSLWRAWECAAYRGHRLEEPVLDVGCGDGAFFRLLWPAIGDVVGIDQDPAVVEAARRSGTYRAVHVAPAQDIPLAAGSVASAFANCSLEHMDDLPRVLSEVARCLRPGGAFLMSVVTHLFVDWAPLPALVEAACTSDDARRLRADYLAYHHLVNPHPPERWREQLEHAGFDVQEQVAIVPEATARLFLFLDHLWHLPGMEEALPSRVGALRDFAAGFREVLSGVLKMEHDWSRGAGVVFRVARR
jgi:SAM-dependent methyltransferase